MRLFCLFLCASLPCDLVECAALHCTLLWLDIVSTIIIMFCFFMHLYYQFCSQSHFLFSVLCFAPVLHFHCFSLISQMNFSLHRGFYQQNYKCIWWPCFCTLLFLNSSRFSNLDVMTVTWGNSQWHLRTWKLTLNSSCHTIQHLLHLFLSLCVINDDLNSVRQYTNFHSTIAPNGWSNDWSNAFDQPYSLWPQHNNFDWLKFVLPIVWPNVWSHEPKDLHESHYVNEGLTMLSGRVV